MSSPEKILLTRSKGALAERAIPCGFVENIWILLFKDYKKAFNKSCSAILDLDETGQERQR